MTTPTAQSIKVHMPKLYNQQRAIFNSRAKYKVVVAGRRAGKTLLGAYMASHVALQGGRVLIASATQSQADVFWKHVTGSREFSWFSGMISFGLIKKNQSTRTLQFSKAIGNGHISCRTAKEPDNLLGDDADLIVVDEAGIIDPVLWDIVLPPMLADRNGNALFIGTPRAKNWFYHLYLRGADKDEPEWESWNFSSLNNPHLSQQALDSLQSNMNQASYQQDILAQFLDDEGAVFKAVRSASYPEDERPQSYEDLPSGTRVHIGVDWGRTSDYTVAIAITVDDAKVIDFDYFTNMPFEEQITRILKLAKKWRVEHIKVEDNSFGIAAFERMQQRVNEYNENENMQLKVSVQALEALGDDAIAGSAYAEQAIADFEQQAKAQKLTFGVSRFNTNAQSKRRIIEQLAVAIENQHISYPDNVRLLGELESFQVASISTIGVPRYAAPSGMHDDMVMALAIAYESVAARGDRWLFR